MPCVSLFITKHFQAVQNKNNFHQDSMLYFIPFRLKIRLLSPELFSSVLGKGLCDGLLTKRFTATSNLTYFSVFLPVPQSFSVCHTVQCNYHS